MMKAQDGALELLDKLRSPFPVNQVESCEFVAKLPIPKHGAYVQWGGYSYIVYMVPFKRDPKLKNNTFGITSLYNTPND